MWTDLLVDRKLPVLRHVDKIRTQKARVDCRCLFSGLTPLFTIACRGTDPVTFDSTTCVIHHEGALIFVQVHGLGGNRPCLQGAPFGLIGCLSFQMDEIGEEIGKESRDEGLRQGFQFFSRFDSLPVVLMSFSRSFLEVSGRLLPVADKLAVHE